MILSLVKQKRLRIITKSLRLVDKLLERIHQDLGLNDREIKPAEIELDKLRMILENMKISIERSVE